MREFFWLLVIGLVCALPCALLLHWLAAAAGGAQ